MILPINNSTTMPVYSRKSTFKQNQGELIKNAKPISKTVRDNIKNLSFPVLFDKFIKKINSRFEIYLDKKLESDKCFDKDETFSHPLLESIAKLFDRRLEFDEYGKLTKTEKYVNNELKTVKHFKAGSFRPYSIDEYKDGQLSKITDFYESSHKPQWISEYNCAGGYDYVREFYKNGNEKSFQVEKDNKIESIAYFNEYGNYIKGEKYNTDETLSSSVSYEKDKVINKYYNHGVLTLVSIDFLYSDLKRDIAYNEKGRIQYVIENDKESSIYYHYTDGKKDWSETKYKDNNILYKKIEYDDFGKPKIEYFYDKRRILSQKTEYNKTETKNTKYNKDGKIIFIETTNNKTNKKERIYQY